jgi:recombination protein RecT
MENQITTKQFFQREDVKSKFNELLGSRTNQFITSVLSIVNNNSYLKNASTESIYTAAMMAAALDLPINSNLGFAYIIPYGSQAQFQVGYKGLIQLALRSGQFKTVSVTPIY